VWVGVWERERARSMEHRPIRVLILVEGPTVDVRID
jgi:hypothetical protein